MKRLITIQILFTFMLAGCTKRTLNEGQAEELLGVSHANTTSFDYFFEGNRAGYIFIARIAADPASMTRLMADATKQNHVLDPADELSIELRKLKFMRNDLHKVAPWLDISWDAPMDEFKAEGQNAFTSQFVKHIFYDSQRGVAYVVNVGT